MLDKLFPWIRLLVWTTWLWVASIMACGESVPSSLRLCESNQNCPAFQVCVSSLCVSPVTASRAETVSVDSSHTEEDASQQEAPAQDTGFTKDTSSEPEPEPTPESVPEPSLTDDAPDHQESPAEPEDSKEMVQTEQLDSDSVTTDAQEELVSDIPDATATDATRAEEADTQEETSPDAESEPEESPTLHEATEPVAESSPEVQPESICQAGVPCVLANPATLCQKGRQVCDPKGQASCVDIQVETVLRLRGHAEGALSPCDPAMIRYPTGIAIDSKHNVYLSDIDNHTIRKIDTLGKITTLAGEQGKSGSKDGTGNKAHFSKPNGLAVDVQGNVFVADTNNHTIRKIQADGTVTTFAGKAGQTGLKDDSGDKARFHSPIGLTMDALGFLYVADAGNHAIRQIDVTGKVVTIAGGSYGFVDAQSTNAKFYWPTGLAFDTTGNLYVADQYNHSIRKISPTGLVSTFAGLNASGYANGLGISARFSYPSALTVGPLGDVFVADTYNHVIRHITPQGMVSLLAGTPSYPGNINALHTKSRFSRPHGLVFNQKGQLLVADQENHVLRVVELKQVRTLAGDFNSFSSIPKDGDALCARIEKPYRGVFDNKGVFYFTDFYNNTIYAISPTGELRVVAGSRQFGAQDGDGSSATFYAPSGIAMDSQNNLYIADTYNHRIRKIDTQGQVTTYAGSSAGFKDATLPLQAQFYYPHGLALDAANNLYVADRYNHRIRIISPQGVVSTFAGSGQVGATDGKTTAATFNQPVALALDSQGQWVIAEAGNHRIRLIDKQSNVLTLAGSTQGYLDGRGTGAKFNTPSDIVFGPNGLFYVAEEGSHFIRTIDAQGNVTTLLGTTQGYLDGFSSVAKFHSPHGLAFDPSGLLWILDTENYAIRRFSLCPP